MTTRRSFVVRTPIVLAAAGAQARGAAEAPSRRLLTGRFPLENLARVLLPRERWLPFAPASTRAGWEALPAPARKDLVAAGERHLGTEWPPLPATLFLEYARNGNRSRYEASAPRGATGCATGAGRVRRRRRAVSSTRSPTASGPPARRPSGACPRISARRRRAPGCRTLPSRSWTCSPPKPPACWPGPITCWGRAGERPAAAARASVSRCDRRMLPPCFERDDFWWMGLDPKRASSEQLEPVDQLQLADVRAAAGAGRDSAAWPPSTRSCAAWTASWTGYHDDGGCDEGPGYWFRAGGSLFDCLELLLLGDAAAPSTFTRCR